jgi:hypothetical protein
MEQVEKQNRAKKKVQELKGFYSNLFTYLIVNLVLIIVNFITSPNNLWFYWVTIFWGLGIVIHAFSVFGKNKMLGDDWEEKKVKEYMDKDKS